MTPDPPPAETRALYESMTTAQLEELRAAFELDVAWQRVAAQSLAFGQSRLGLIADVLAARCAKMSGDEDHP